MDSVDGETAELLRTLIRNRCVNDGSPESGHEIRNVDVLRQVLDVPDIDLEVYAPEGLEHRPSLVARIEGHASDDKRMALVSHTDVVPATPEGWDNDPFGGDLLDGEIWGRGAVDMLGQTAAMAVALRRLGLSRWRPDGTVLFLALADEEAGSVYGCNWLFEHHLDAVIADVAFGEAGGVRINEHVTVATEEKGCSDIDIVVKGTASHGALPWDADNAIEKAAEILHRLREYRTDTVISPVWRAWIESQNLSSIQQDLLSKEETLLEELPSLPRGLASLAYSANHTTLSPNMIRGGIRRNVIPDLTEIRLDVRLRAGDRSERIREELLRLLDDFGTDVEITIGMSWEGTRSSPSGPAWRQMQRATKAVAPTAKLLPTMISGATDMRFYRQHDVPAYGFGLLSPLISYDEYWARFHGINERIDVQSLALSTSMWEALTRAFNSNSN
jgi:acetylornithine deacetylase/succinyl-diaminopimelate desuccinylase-like protein